MRPSLPRRHRSTRRASAGIMASLLAAGWLAIPIAAPVVSAASPVSITNVDSPDPVASGAQLTYTITVTNTGGAKLTNMVLTDQLNGVGGIGVPPQLVLTSSQGTCTQTTTQVMCNGGTLGGFSSWTVTIRGVVTAAGGSTLNNTATVTGTKSATTFSASGTASTLVTGTTPGGGQPDLTISKNGPGNIAQGQTLTYTLTVNNLGTANASNVRVMDTVPAGVGSLTASGTSLFVCAIVSQTVTCDGGAVNAGANATITISGSVTAAVGATLENTAVVDPDNTIAEGNEFNNTSNTVSTSVGSPPALPFTLTKVVDKAQASPNDILTYTVTVKNGTLGRADYVTVTDGTQGLDAASLSASATVLGGSGTTPACTIAAPQVTCTMTRLATNDSLVVTIKGRVIAPAGTTIINTASANLNIKNVGYTATASATTVIKPGIDLTITKAAAPDPVCASSWPGAGTADCRGGLTYSFVVGNSGLNAASNVLVRDPLPAGTTFDAASSSALCSVSAGVVTCTIPTVAAESTFPFTITVVAPPTTGSITNNVTVDPNNSIYESDETNNVASVSTTVSTGVDLTIAKTDASPGFDPIATNGTQTWTITVGDKGTQDATGVKVRDTLPAGTTFLAASGDHGFTCSFAAPDVTCVGGSLQGTKSTSYPGAVATVDTATITIKAFAPNAVGTMTNVARVDPDGTIAEYDETNDTASEPTVITNGDSTKGAFNELSITKTASPTTVSTSSVETYTIVVTNNGTDPAVNVAVRDVLPAGFTFQSATDTVPGPTAFLCTQASGTVTCSGATIPGLGGARTIQIVTLATSVPGTWRNTALVDPDNAIPEGDETNNAAYADVTVVVGPPPVSYIDLTLTKDDGVAAGAHVTPGGTITYTLTAGNLGTQPAFGVVVSDPLPAGTTFVSALDTTAGSPPGAFTCSQSSGVVTCTGGTIDGTSDLISTIGTSRTITIVVKATMANTTIINQATVDPDNTIAEGDETNNTASATTQVRSNINLTLEKNGPDQASQGTDDHYKLTVKNVGTADATGVLVEDALPAGLIPLGVDAGTDNNFLCTVFENPVNKVDCTGDLAAGQTITIDVHVFITADGGTLRNEACVDPNDTILEYDTADKFNPDGNGDNCSFKPTVVTHDKADIAVNKSQSAAVVTPGADLTYTINVSNVGTGDAQSPVVVTDVLPSSVTFGDANASNGWTCTKSAGTVSCQDPGTGLAVGANSLITIHTTVKASASLPFTNTASVPADPGNGSTIDPEANTDNNTSSVTTSVGGGSGIDLSIASITDVPDPVNRGHQLVYTVLATNNGTAAANGVDVKIDLPPTGTTFVGAAGTNGVNCGTPSGSTLTCTGDFPGGGSSVITVTLAVVLGAPDDLALTATIDPSGAFTESDETNNTKTETTTVSGNTCTSSPCIDLVAAQIASTPPGPVNSGDSVQYTFAVVNVGDTATAVGKAHIHFGIKGDFSGGVDHDRPAGRRLDLQRPDQQRGRSVVVLRRDARRRRRHQVHDRRDRHHRRREHHRDRRRRPARRDRRVHRDQQRSAQRDHGHQLLTHERRGRGRPATAARAHGREETRMTRTGPRVRLRRGYALIARIAAIALVANAVLVVVAPATASAVDITGTCGKRYIAAGDHLPAGHEVSSTERFPSHLLTDHLQKYGWCVMNIAANDTTSSSYISGGQLSQTWNYRPDLITLTVGEENSSIVDLVNSCFDKVKSHDFSGGNACAAAILANSTLYTNLTNNLTSILQQYRMIMAGRPGLVVAVTGYPNPYPKADDATTDIASLCTPLIDNVIPCTTRWAQLPPALVTIDQVFQKLNSTIQNAVKPFQAGPSGNRYVFVDTYTKTRDHCMKMEVTMKTTVEHPEEDGAVHQHDDTTATNFGCSDPWFVAGSDGTDMPTYLQPSTPGVLTNESQTTSGMGIHPNDKGHKCISDLIWEADTIDPGTTPLKWKLGVPEAANPNICQ